jgi:hypothetical protein
MPRIVPTAAIGLVLAASAVAAAVAIASGSGIRGRVTASPTCPVETVPPQPGCEPRGFKARVRIVRLSDHHVVARIVTAGDGRFRVRLRAARYSVSAVPANGASLPRCPKPVRATVRRGRYAPVAIDCDSGIR